MRGGQRFLHHDSPHSVMEASRYVLDGVSVLDLSTFVTGGFLSMFVTGGFCSLMLANQGADVVKIERPDAGDDIRHSGPPSRASRTHSTTNRPPNETS